MLDHHHRVPRRGQALQHSQQLPNVLEVQPGGGLVQNVEGVAGGTLLELRGQLDPLGLAAGERGGGLPQLDVSQADIGQRLEVPGDGGDVLEELEALVHAHGQHVGDGAVLVLHLERLAVVPLPLAHLARHVHVGKEVHLDLDLSVTRAVLASAAARGRHVEREPARRVAANASFRYLREQLSYVVEHADVGGRVRPWSPPDR